MKRLILSISALILVGCGGGSSAPNSSEITGTDINSAKEPLGLTDTNFNLTSPPKLKPAVRSHSPDMAMLNQVSTFTYNGSNLISGMGFAVTNCDAVSDLGGNTTSRSFSCIPRATGSQTLTIKTAPGSTVLYTGTVHYKGAPDTPKRVESEFMNSSAPMLGYRSSKNFVVFWDKRWNQDSRAEWMLTWAEKVWTQAAEWGMVMPKRSDQVLINIYIHTIGGTNPDLFPDGWGQGVGTNAYGMPFYTSPIAALPFKFTEQYSMAGGNLLHELFHLMQWQSSQTTMRYGGENVWYGEGMANWFERLHIPDELNALRGFGQGVPAFGFQPQLELWHFDTSTWSRAVHAYASELFFKYLTDHKIVPLNFFPRSYATGWNGTAMEYLARHVPNLESAYQHFATRLVTLDGYSPQFKQAMRENQAFLRTVGKSINNLRSDGSFDENTYVAVLTEMGSSAPIVPAEKNRAWSYTTTRINIKRDAALNFNFVADVLGSRGTPSVFTLTIVKEESDGAVSYTSVRVVKSKGHIRLAAKAGQTLYAVAVSTPKSYTGSETFGYQLGITGVTR